jgi:hypothetical protein
VESVLLNVPIPPVYTAQLPDGKEIVIDGQQRLTSLFSFIDGKLPQDGKDFKLRGLSVITELNGSSFKNLDQPSRRAFQNYDIPIIVLSKESNDDVRFEIFERLNTGSVTLNDQELRNCVYRGIYNVLIKELAENNDFQFILNSPRLHERMLDSELVLRFLTFYHSTYLKYTPPMKRMMNKDMEKYQDLKENETNELKSVFTTSVELTKLVFGDNAFRRFVRGTLFSFVEGELNANMNNEYGSVSNSVGSWLILYFSILESLLRTNFIAGPSGRI